MTTLPPAVMDRIHQYSVDSRTPAFLLTDRRTRLVAMGGHLRSFGVADIPSGAAVTEHVPFLHGLLPLEQDAEQLSCIEIAEGIFADVLLFHDADGDWVVLLDASREAARQQLVQQQGHALELLDSGGVHSAPADEEARLISAVLSELDAVVLERTSRDRFRVLGSAPEWLMKLWPQVTRGEGARVQDSSPFLENFLVDAAQVWQAPGEPRGRRSGMWTETSAVGDAWVLEATAVRLTARDFLVIREVTGRHREQLRLQQRARDTDLSYEQLSKEIERKDVLLHCIVHDLRSPLVSIQSGLQLLAAEQLTDQAQRLVDVCRTQIAREDTLIRTILDVFAPDVHGLEQNAPKQPRVSMVDRARQVAAGFQPIFDLHELDLKLEIELDTQVHVRADPMRLDRVFANLLENALRHSPPGGVVTLLICQDEDSVAAFVDDEGRGVPQELTGQLFDRFSQLGGEPGNMGLGLHFCRITIEAWSGSVGYETREPRGARFWFRLPRC